GPACHQRSQGASKAGSLQSAQANHRRQSPSSSCILRSTMRCRWRRLAMTVSAAIAVTLTLAGRTFGQGNSDWTEPFPPFHIVDNVYYVGSKGLANYLITTPRGHILINSDLDANV